MRKHTVRHSGMDVIRCLALVCVISVHFFAYSGFYEETVSGYQMLAMVVARNSVMICVPLFLMLSGYLIRSRPRDPGYYFKLIRVIFVYIAASLFCVFYKKYVAGSKITTGEIFLKILSFEAAPYGWYIEMYIGLFLLIPFLNALYESLDSGEQKKRLMLTLLVLTALPTAINIFCNAGSDWWRMPSSSSDYLLIIPQWWKNIYPITYFYLGRYLREYPLKIRAWQKILLIFITFALAGAFNYYRSYGSVFVRGPWQEYGSLFITGQTVLVFSLFADLEYRFLPGAAKRVLARISDLSLGAYLCSWILDQIVYSRMRNVIGTIPQQVRWFPAIVLTVLTGSLLISEIINLLYTVTGKVMVDRCLRKYSRSK